MPFSKELPEWFKSATTPTLTKKNEGWGAGEHPPAALFNWFFNTSYLAIKELQDNAVHKDQKGVANGVATLDATGDIPIGQADNILNWVKGFGLGDVAKDISNTDLNALDATGIYRGTNLTNGPETPVNSYNYAVIHIKKDATNKTQLLVAQQTNNNRLFLRTLNAGTWTPWTQLATYDANGKILPANLPAATTSAQGAVILDDAINSNSTTKAATANAVLKLSQVIDNAGIGNFAKDISNSDLNSLDGTGIYRGNNLTNRPGTGPTTEWYYVMNMKHAAAYKVQIAYRLDNGNNQIFRRVQNNGVWSQWVEEVAVDPTGTINLRHLPEATTTAEGVTQLNDNTNSASTTQAATANAVKKVMDTIINGGLSGDAVDKSGTDLNLIDKTGFYKANTTGTTNIPPGNNFIHLIHMNYRAADAAQMAISFVTGAVHTRHKTNNVWSSWVQTAQYDSTGKVAAANLPAATTSATGIAQLNDNTNSSSVTQAATANAVKKVMDYVVGAGLGDIAKSITSTDLNNLDPTGFFRGDNLTNAPIAGGSFTVINQKIDANYKTQIAIQYASTGAGNAYTRIYRNGVWSAWVQLATYDDSGKVATANLPDASTSTKGIVQLNDNTNNASTTQAATANAVKKVMDVVVGAGVGDIAKDISNTDLNVLDGSGFFKGQQLTNNPLGGPSGTWYYIFQMKHAASYKVQTAYRLDNVNNQMFKRVLSNNVWSVWTEISTTKYVDDNIATAVKAHTDLTNNPHNVTTKQVNIYTPATDATASGDDIPDGVTVGSIPPNATGYPKAWGTIQNFKQSSVRCMQYWYDTGELSNRQKPQYRTWYGTAGNGWSPWTELETTAGAQAKVDATQKFKITKDDGIIKDIGVGIQINAVWTAGIYYVSAAALTNAPVNVVGVLEVQQYNANTAMQTYTVMDPANPRQFIRYGAGGSWGAWKESATVDKVQVAKITADSGADKQSVAAGEDLPAKALTWGTGFHTFYAAGGVLNGPDASVHCRGYFSRDSGNLGYLFAVDGYGKTHINRYNAGSWSGWKTSTIEQDAGFIGTLFGKVGTNNRGPVAVLRAGNNDTDGFGVALGGGGYTVLGGGESAAAILSALAAADVNKESAEVAAENDVFISPGTNTTTPATRKTSIFKASGNVILPYMSYVSANAGVEQTFPSGVATKFKFTVALTDQQGEFNTSLGRFTAKDDGVYELRLAADLTAQVVSTNISLNVYRNGSQGSTLAVIGAGTPYIAGTTLIKINAGDYLEIYLSSSQSVYIPSANITIAKIQ